MRMPALLAAVMPMSDLSREEIEQYWDYTDATWPQVNAPTFLIEDADLVEPKQMPWLVKELFPKVGLVFIAGPSGCGKSFLALDMASKIATGNDILERWSAKSPVLYIAAEGANGARGRLKAIRNKVGPWNGNVRFISKPVLIDDANLAALKIAIQDYPGESPGAVIFDTFSASVPGADENSGAEMGNAVSKLQCFAEELQTCVVIIAHTGKDHSKGLRGWSGLHAAADAVLLLDQTAADGTRKGMATKIKDGDAGWCFSFHLEQRPIGRDDEDEVITSCVVEDLVTTVQSRTSATSKSDSDGDTLLKTFDRLKLETLPDIAGDGRGHKGTMLVTLREGVFQAGLCAEIKPKDGTAQENQRWCANRKKAWQRALTKLCAQNRLKRDGEYVWRPAAGTSERDWSR
jgi:hypothetical protein